jgi:parallel beta-helix repeat protein
MRATRSDGGVRRRLCLGLGLFIATLAAARGSAEATQWYVDGVNGVATNPGTLAAPFKGPQQAMAVAKPGDTIYLLPTAPYAGLAITTSGAPGKPLTVMGAGLPPNLTQIRGDGTASAVWIDANYVTVSGFDTSALGQNFGFFVQLNHHHVTIENSIAHDCGAAGISAIADDYIMVLHNIVYGNARNTTGWRQNSGISLADAVDIDSYTGVKNIVADNIAYDNTNTPNCSIATCLAGQPDSDGSGIIIDDFLRTHYDNIPYRGRTVVMNNVVFGNGGRGIYVFSSNHVTVSDNTAFSNNQDFYEGNWHPGEIGLLAAGDVSVYNNILYSDGKATRNPGGTPNTHVALSIDQSENNVGAINAHSNIMFNPQNDPTLALFIRASAPLIISNNVWEDPRLRVLSLTPSLTDLRPTPISPALNQGDPANAVAQDIDDVPRTGNTTVGAYETPLN